ncbi:MAG: hypothetical protein LBE34_01265 [Flavobacteriaceae bacterium]|jgi:hypothetical protein|nr:hypothetical protein [Flavobacteriaceae bacterium]
MVKYNWTTKPMTQILAIGLFVFIAFTSCTKGAGGTGKDGAVARVNSTYLDRDEILNNVPSGVSSKDSASIAERYIDKWATKMLLIDAAQFNLSDDKVEEIDQLVKQFKDDLLIKAYLDKLVQQSVDTVVSEKDLKDYYEHIKKNFLVDDMLVRMAYINVLKDNSHYANVKKAFSIGQKDDYKKLEELSLQFKNYALNDSVWVNVGQVYDKLPFISSENKQSYLKNNNYFEVSDENSTYFVRVKQVLNKGTVVPYSYLRPSLRLMVLNDRKMELIKQIEQDIIKDAKKDKSYEVFK